MNILDNRCVSERDLCDSDNEEHNYAVSTHPVDNSIGNPNQILNHLNIKTEMSNPFAQIDIKCEPLKLGSDIKLESESPTTSTNRVQVDDDRDYKTFTWTTPGKQEIGVAGVIRNMKVEAVEEEQSDSTSSMINLNETNSSIYKCNKCSLNFDDPQILDLHTKDCRFAHNENASSKYSEQVIANLIKSVRNHICLYNKQHQYYKDHNYKNQLWDTIATSCDLQNGCTAKAIWQEMKRDFFEYLRRSNPRKHSKWHQHFKSLQFVSPFRSNLPENNYSLSVDLDTQYISDSSIEASASGESPNKRARLSESGLTNEHRSRKNRRMQEWKMLKEKICDYKKASHPLDTFFLAMRETTKTLPLPLQIQVKKLVFNAVVEAEDAALYSSTQQENLSSEDD